MIEFNDYIKNEYETLKKSFIDENYEVFLEHCVKTYKREEIIERTNL